VVFYYDLSFVFFTLLYVLGGIVISHSHEVDIFYLLVAYLRKFSLGLLQDLFDRRCDIVSEVFHSGLCVCVTCGCRVSAEFILLAARFRIHTGGCLHIDTAGHFKMLVKCSEVSWRVTLNKGGFQRSFS
jgi:hypothetical protein